MRDVSLYEWPQQLLMIAICMSWVFLMGREFGQRKPPRVRFDNWFVFGTMPLYVYIAMLAAEVPLGGAFRWVVAACALPLTVLGVQRLICKPVEKDSLKRVQRAGLLLLIVGALALLFMNLD